MAKKKPVVAIVYDFDGTLAPGNMQEHSYIPSLGMTKDAFWKEVKRYARENDMDEILSYMFLMIKKAREIDLSINRRQFKEHGRNLPFFDGVEGWFDRINAYGHTKSVKVEHYIVSSGLREIIEGSRIKSKFNHIFASAFMFDADGVAIWPAVGMNYTYKTQFLFRINKGIMNSFDNEKINKYVPEDKRPVQFSNMIYVGDGETDVPCMKMVKYQGGHAVAVFNPNKRRSKKKKSAKDIAFDLIKEKRADFAVPAKYTESSELDMLMKSLIDKIAADEVLRDIKLKAKGKKNAS